MALDQTFQGQQRGNDGGKSVTKASVARAKALLLSRIFHRRIPCVRFVAEADGQLRTPSVSAKKMRS